MLLGLAFKPDTNDVRDASSLVLAPRLLAEGAHVRAWDPVAVEDARPHLPGVQLYEDLLEAVSGADAVVIVTEWDELKAFPRPEVRTAMKNPLIVDGRNLLDPEAVRRAGFASMRIGRPPARDEDRLVYNLSSPPERRLARLLPCRRADDAARPLRGGRVARRSLLRGRPPSATTTRMGSPFLASLARPRGGPDSAVRTARWIIVDVRSEPSSCTSTSRRWSSRSALDTGVGRLSSGSVLDRLCDHDVGRRLHRNGGAVTGRPTYLDRKQPPPLRASRARARARTRSGDRG